MNANSNGCLSPDSDLLLHAAEEHSRILCDEHLGTEHLLLALTSSTNSPAELALSGLGVNLKRFLGMLSSKKPGTASPDYMGYRPPTENLKRVLKYAAQLTPRESPVEPGHIAMALQFVPECWGAKILDTLRVDHTRLRNLVLAYMAGTGRGAISTDEPTARALYQWYAQGCPMGIQPLFVLAHFDRLQTIFGEHAGESPNGK